MTTASRECTHEDTHVDTHVDTHDHIIGRATSIFTRRGGGHPDESAIYRFRYTHDGKYIVAQDTNAYVRIFHANDGALIREIDHVAMTTFSISVDSRLLAILTTTRPHTCVLYEIENIHDPAIVPARFEPNLVAHTNHYSMRFTPTHQLLFYSMCTDNDSKRLAIYATLPTLQTTPFIFDTSQALEISPNGAFVSVQHERDGPIRVLKTASLTFVDAINHCTIAPPAIHNNGLLSVSSDICVYERDSAGGVYKRRDQYIPGRSIFSESCGLYSYMIPNASDTYTLLVRRMSDGAVVRTCRSDSFRLMDEIEFSPDETSIIHLASSFHNQFHVIDIATLVTILAIESTAYAFLQPTRFMRLVWIQDG
jgi:WD40 repeat protein